MIHPRFHSLTHLHPAHPLMPPQAAYALANACRKRRAGRHLATADYRPCPNQHDVANKRSRKQEYVHRPRKHRVKLPKHMREPKAQLRPGKTTDSHTSAPISFRNKKWGKNALNPQTHPRPLRKRHKPVLQLRPADPALGIKCMRIREERGVVMDEGASARDHGLQIQDVSPT